MKTLKKIAIFVIVVMTLTSCEDVINIPLETAAPKLVIDASIKWQKGTNGSVQKIKLTTTTDYYSATIPPATGANVTVTNISLTEPEIYPFVENEQTGEYICSNFKPIVGNNYRLSIIYSGQSYTATTQFMATPTIVKTEQILKPGFGTEDFYEIKFFFQDNATENNFYLIGVKNSNFVLPEYRVLSDQFTQGNLMFAVYQDELKTDDIVNFSIQGITEKYNNYMNKLVSIAGANSGSPFATPPATLRGNIVNNTNLNNFPFGYFHLSEIDSGSSTIK